MAVVERCAFGRAGFYIDGIYMDSFFHVEALSLSAVHLYIHQIVLLANAAKSCHNNREETSTVEW